MSLHQTWVDESTDHDPSTHTKFQAVCGGEGCLWSSRWFHSDWYMVETVDGDCIDDGIDKAADQALLAGRGHEEDMNE